MSVQRASGQRVPGIDVSRWQRQIDWERVAADGYRFAFIRATIGDDYTDPRFYVNWDGARLAGLLLAPYHVLTPNVPPGDQIDFFFQSLGSRRGDMPPVLDVERDDGARPDVITACVASALEMMEARDGRKPIIYTARWCWNRWVRSSPRWRAYDLWVASYTSEPLLPRDWDTWMFWQYSDRGDVSGVGAPSTDLNWFAGSWQELQQYSGGAEVTPDDREPDARVRARVIVPEIEVWSGPGDDYEHLGTLTEETEVEILSIEGRDVWIEFEPGRWVAFSQEGERRMVWERTLSSEGASEDECDNDSQLEGTESEF